MPRYYVDNSQLGTFRSEDLPSDEELQAFYEELLIVGDRVQEDYGTKYLHLVLNRYVRMMRSKVDRRFVAAELFNVILWQISNSIVREIEEPNGRLIDEPEDEEEIPYGIVVEDDAE